MTTSARTSAPELARLQHLERLTDAVNRLADEVLLVRDVLDETREDLRWLTRNGLSHQPTVHKQLVRSARDPLAPDANERLEFRRISIAAGVAANGLSGPGRNRLLESGWSSGISCSFNEGNLIRRDWVGAHNLPEHLTRRKRSTSRCAEARDRSSGKGK